MALNFLKKKKDSEIQNIDAEVDETSDDLMELNDRLAEGGLQRSTRKSWFEVKQKEEARIKSLLKQKQTILQRRQQELLARKQARRQLVRNTIIGARRGLDSAGFTDSFLNPQSMAPQRASGTSSIIYPSNALGISGGIGPSGAISASGYFKSPVPVRNKTVRRTVRRRRK